MRDTSAVVLDSRLVRTAASALLLLVAARAEAAEPDLARARKLNGAGRVVELVDEARRALAGHSGDEEWHHLLVQALVARGQLLHAGVAMETWLSRHGPTLRSLLAGETVARRSGDGGRHRTARDALRAFLNDRGARLEAADELVLAAEGALALGDDPRAVLSTYLEPAARKEPKLRAVYLAAGSLALRGHDDALGARWFRRGLQAVGPDADLHFGLARSLRNGDRKKMVEALDAVLHLDGKHVPALLLRAEHAIDGEDTVGARAALGRALAAQPGCPGALALEAVLAHLSGDQAGEARAVTRALAVWPADPEVPSLVGRKLSAKYRFTEGAAYQRKALKLDAAHGPAKLQLAQDLLRLGQEPEGWRLIEEVNRSDPYDVVAFNLVTLRKHLEAFTTLRGHGVELRMDPREAKVYGDQALAHLHEARTALDARWGLPAGRPVTVEIFPDQGDFAVRTFGEPGGAAYLGVCFGRLITMNSPAGTGSAAVANWKAVLWHEYAHVVTLGLTRNKMPRWLSEGISVWEERRRDPSWGQVMTGRFREMILGGELTPVSKLSSAFLAPRTSDHLMFAYFQSALFVEYVVGAHGFDALKAIIGDLGAGKEINRALAARTVALPDLEKAFDAFARERARALAPRADWTRTEDKALAGDAAALRRWLARHPDSVWGLQAEARRLVEAGDFKHAVPLLERLLALHPTQRDEGGTHEMVSLAYRKLGAGPDERRALERWAGLAGDAGPAFARLVELSEAQGDWTAVARNAERLLAVNPLAVTGWRALARAEETRAGTDKAASERAVTAYRKVLALEPPDPADAHFRLARLLRGHDRAAARRHVLDALAEAPRFREAHQLLLELTGGGK